MPAQASSMFTGPSWRCNSSIALAKATESVTFAVAQAARLPANAAANDASGSGDKSIAAMAAPSAANDWASLRPMPLPAPVTKTTWLEASFIAGGVAFGKAGDQDSVHLWNLQLFRSALSLNETFRSTSFPCRL